MVFKRTGSCGGMDKSHRSVSIDWTRDLLWKEEVDIVYITIC
jgi:hypothetical protein